MKDFFILINIFILLISQTKLVQLKLDSNIINIDNKINDDKIKLANFFKNEYDWNFDSFNKYNDATEKLTKELNLILDKFDIRILFAENSNKNLNPNNLNKVQIKYLINSTPYTLKLKNIKNLNWIKGDINNFFQEEHDLNLGFNNSIKDVISRLTEKLKKLTNNEYDILIEVNDNNKNLEKLNMTKFIIEFKIKIAHEILIKKLTLINIKNNLDIINKIDNFFEIVHEINDIPRENEIKTILEFINNKINKLISSDITIQLSNNEKKIELNEYNVLLQVNVSYYGSSFEKNLKINLIYNDVFILKQLELFFHNEYNWEFKLNSTENDALIRLSEQLLKKLGNNIFNYLKLVNLQDYSSNNRILLEKNLIKVSIRITVKWWNSFWNNDFIFKLNVINNSYNLINKIKKYCENEHVWYELSDQHTIYDALDTFKNKLIKFLEPGEYAEIDAITLINKNTEQLTMNSNHIDMVIKFYSLLIRNFNIRFKVVNSLSQVTLYKITEAFKKSHKWKVLNTLRTYKEALFAMHTRIFVDILNKIERKKYRYIKLFNIKQENKLLKNGYNYIEVLIKIDDNDVKKFTLNVYV